VIFEIGSFFWAMVASYFMLPAVARMTGNSHYTQLLVEMGACKHFLFLPVLAWSHDPSDLSLPA
jgi:hypothetical protein